MVASDRMLLTNKVLGLQVVVSEAKEMDGKTWRHVSLSRRSRTPSYADMVLCKRLFIGNHRKAIQVFPAVSEHVNTNPFYLHLWSCMDKDTLPDFSRGADSI